MDNAVQEAARIAESGDVVLLSPGGTSFDAYRDFAERGESSGSWVQKCVGRGMRLKIKPKTLEE